MNYNLLINSSGVVQVVRSVMCLCVRFGSSKKSKTQADPVEFDFIVMSSLSEHVIATKNPVDWQLIKDNWTLVL